MTLGRPPKVSVIVPSYNPGGALATTIESILDQARTWPFVEAIFVDDGSTDSSPEQLDGVAAAHPDVVQVIHTPPSGAPGRPRNIGLQAARGEYIQFVDADDTLAPGALEMLSGLADGTGADVVVERFASATITRSQRLFERSVRRTTLAATPRLVDSSLALAKLFRRSFLATHGLTFEEGWRRLEDELFTLLAFLHAKTISIQAEEPVYFFRRRTDGGHLTAEPVDPGVHFRNLRTVLDRVDETHPPRDVRERIRRRMLRVQVLRTLTEPEFVALTEHHQRLLVDGVRDLLAERFDGTLSDGVDGVERRLVTLVRDGSFDQVAELARRLDGVEAAGRVLEVRWADSTLHLRGIFGFVERARPNAAWVVPGELDVELRTERRPRIDVVLRHTETGTEWYVEALTPARTSAAAPVDMLAFERTVAADIERIGAGARRLAPGTWDVLVRIDGFGLRRVGPLRGSRAMARAIVSRDPLVPTVAVLDEQGLRIIVDARADLFAAAVASQPMLVLAEGDRIALELGVPASAGAGSRPAGLVLGRGPGAAVLRGTVRGQLGHTVAEIRVSGLVPRVAGQVDVALRLGVDGDADVAVGIGHVRRGGLVLVPSAALVQASLATRALRPLAWRWTASFHRASWLARRCRERAVIEVRTLGRRLPAGAARRVRALAPRMR